MPEVPNDRRYTKDHEWARAEEGRIVIGITDYAQDQLGDVVFVGLPEPGTEVQANQPLGEVESTKSVSDVYSPVTGKVLAKNNDVEQNPELINEDPYDEGWLVTIEGNEDDVAELMSAEEYERFTRGSSERDQVD